jgi:predicted Zn-dependent protease
MRGNWKIRIFIGLAIVAFAYWKKCANTQINPYTGVEQVISISPQEEIAIGLNSAPQMAEEYGGLYPNQEMQDLVDKVGYKLVNNMKLAQQHPYKFEFHLLADPQTINAFALPGGQVFITYALFSKLQNEDQLAGVLGHEIGHVLGRHSAERIANTEFWQTISQGASVGADAGGLVAGIGQNVLLGNGRDDELESDNLGVKFMLDAGYNPCEMIGVMEILKAASGPSRVPEFKSTHPDPENRMQRINDAVKQYRGDSCL